LRVALLIYSLDRIPSGKVKAVRPLPMGSICLEKEHLFDFQTAHRWIQ